MHVVEVLPFGRTSATTTRAVTLNVTLGLHPKRCVDLIPFNLKMSKSIYMDLKVGL